MAKEKSPKGWFTYIVKCSDNTLYTGITTDIERRINEHNADKLGARYTRNRQPVELVYKEPLETRSEASKREIAIKRLKKKEKEALIARFKKTIET